MVGYRKEDTLSSSQKLVAGVVSGMVTRFITQPMDVIKLRTQLQKKVKSSSRKYFETTRKILRDEGITAFWRGHNLGQIHSIIAVSSQFYIYELTTKYVATHILHEESNYKYPLRFLCGIISGCCTAVLVLPVEVIRVRQMIVKDQYKGLLNGARRVYKHGGIFAFYEGFYASILQLGPAVGISFSVFSTLQPRILKYLHEYDHGTSAHGTDIVHKAEYVLLASTIAGTTAGFVSKTLTYPFDLAKRRMQISSHREDKRYPMVNATKNLIKCKKLFECLFQTFQYEGLRGLYRGWKVTIYKAQLTSVVAFTSYELMCLALREFET